MTNTPTLTSLPELATPGFPLSSVAGSVDPAGTAAFASATPAPFGYAFVDASRAHFSAVESSRNMWSLTGASLDHVADADEPRNMWSLTGASLDHVADGADN